MLDIYSDLQTHIIRQARIEVTAAYALNYLELRVLKPSKLLQDFVYLRQDPRNIIITPSARNDHHDNDVNNILIKYTDNERQRYNILIEDYNRAGKREDNILTIDKCRTGHSNKKDIEADEREEETRVRLRESSEEIHNILLREFRGANDFTESVTHNDDEQELEPEDCDALVERYEEEINCSDLYSTV
ncbi:hypothetical protein HBI85_215980 [Parastagonospora nodorum]|nr:hypothetical protein HBI85_215980 [Parastagonospora nodorum]